MHISHILDSQFSQIFIKHGIEYIQELILYPIEDLVKKTGLDRAILQSCLSKAQEWLIPKHQTAYSMHLSQQETYLSTGARDIDDLLKGGYPCGTLVEISGESGVGKTHFCLHASIQAQLPLELGGLDSQVIYICTDHQFPLKRLDSLISHYMTLYPHLDYLSRFYIKSRIHVLYVTDLHLQHFITCYQLPYLMREWNARLVIIDSISCNFSCETFEGSDKSQILYEIAKSLKWVSNRENAVILITNQVVDNFQEPNTTLLNVSMNRGIQNSLLVDMSMHSQKKKASLGLVWSCFINSRLYIERICESKRSCRVELSSLVDVLNSVEFIINEFGICSS